MAFWDSQGVLRVLFGIAIVADTRDAQDQNYITLGDGYFVRENYDTTYIVTGRQTRIAHAL